MTGPRGKIEERLSNEVFVDTSLSRKGHFQKYHNTLCLSSKILHKHCFYFLLGPLQVPGENENNVYVKFWKTNKEYYGIFESGLYCKVIKSRDGTFTIIETSVSFAW